MVNPAGTVTGEGFMASRTRTPAKTARNCACCPSAVAAAIRNQAIMTSHSPPTTSPRANSNRPTRRRNQPNPRPAAAAPAAALARSPVRHHRKARSSRPPSSGAAGTELNSASRRLITASHVSASLASPGPAEVSTSHAPSAKPPPRTRLTSGPTPAIRSSAAGVDASDLSLATPPRSHSTMSSTSTLFRRATTAWASS